MAYANVHINRFKRNEILSIFLLLLFIAGVIHKKGREINSFALPLSASQRRKIPDSIQCANRTVLPQQAVWIRLFGKIRTECSCRESPTTKKVCCKEFATHLVLIRHSATFMLRPTPREFSSGIVSLPGLPSLRTPPVGFSCGLLLPDSSTDFSSKSYSSSPPSSSHPRVFGGKKGIRTPETLLRFTRFPGGPVQPLLHLSV